MPHSFDDQATLSLAEQQSCLRELNKRKFKIALQHILEDDTKYNALRQIVAMREVHTEDLNVLISNPSTDSR